MKEEYKVIEWNIDMAVNGEFIPVFVSEAIAKEEADIVILTEFAFCKDENNQGMSAADFLKKTFSDKGYDYYPKFPTKNTQNRADEVLIAWKREKFSVDKSCRIFSAVCSPYKNVPNFLAVPLIDADGKNKLIAAGVRITMTTARRPTEPSPTELAKYYQKQAQLRYKEMMMVYAVLEMISEKDTKVLIAGDFNNYRRGTKIQEWNMDRITCGEKKYTAYTPAGGSCDISTNGTEFPEDHFITRSCEIKDPDYNRGFTAYDRSIYRNGNSLYGIKPPYPDHAMLTGTLILDGENN